jgi:hypothetical protein
MWPSGLEQQWLPAMVPPGRQGSPCCERLPPSPSVQVQLDVPHHTTMLELHQRVHPKHTVVGWFSTGLEMTGRDALIHSFYSKGRASACGVKSPMHLVVDTDLSINDRVSIKAHVSRKLKLGGTEIAAEFIEVPTTVLTSGSEGLALDALREERLDAIPGDSENFRKSFATLQDLVSEAHAYVTAVVEGRREPDVTVGRSARLLFPLCPVWALAHPDTCKLRGGCDASSIAQCARCKGRLMSCI